MWRHLVWERIEIDMACRMLWCGRSILPPGSLITSSQPRLRAPTYEGSKIRLTKVLGSNQRMLKGLAEESSNILTIKVQTFISMYIICICKC